MSKIVMITGGSSGIGLCTAAALREKGCKVYELSRRDSEVPGITHLKCDITDEEQVKAAVAQVMAENGRIDILINNAGFGISGAVEFTETEDARRLLCLRCGSDRIHRWDKHTCPKCGGKMQPTGEEEFWT